MSKSGTVLLISSIISSVICDYPKKCCEDGEHFNQDTNLCESSAVKGFSSFAKVVEKFRSDFEVCSENLTNFCLDITNDGQYVLISTRSGLEAKRSCCFTKGTHLDDQCSKVGDKLTLRNLAFHDERAPPCNESLTTTLNGTIRILSGSGSQRGYSLKVCASSLKGSDNTPTYHKCCGSQESLREDIFECTPTEKTADPQFYNNLLHPYFPDRPYVALSGSPELLNCQDLQVLGFDPEEEYRFGILHNRSLFVENYNDSFPDYCVEYISRTNGSGRTVALLCISDEVTPNSALAVRLYFWFYILAIPFLLAVLVVYLALPDHHNLQGRIVVSYVASLTTFYVCMAIISKYSTSVQNDGFCVFIGVSAHFSFLCAFTWLAIKGLDLCFAIRFMRLSQGKTGYSSYSLAGWGIPALIVAFGLIVQYILSPTHLASPNYGSTSCFVDRVSSPKPFLFYVLMPLAILLCTNIITFIISATIIWNSALSAQKMSPTSVQVLKTRLQVVLRIFLTMGMTWVFDLISFLAPGLTVWIVFDIVNIITAVLIFYIYVFKRQVAEQLYSRYPKIFSFLRRYDVRRTSMVSMGTRTTTPKTPDQGNINSGFDGPKWPHTKIRD